MLREPTCAMQPLAPHPASQYSMMISSRQLPPCNQRSRRYGSAVVMLHAACFACHARTPRPARASNHTTARETCAQISWHAKHAATRSNSEHHRDAKPEQAGAGGSRSPSLRESLLASLDEVLSSGLVLAERLGAMTGMGSRRRVHPPKTPRPRPKSNHIYSPHTLACWASSRDSAAISCST
jgi:hypothetical protein